MLTTVETIQISETTTSCRVEIRDVNFDATLDERYQQHRELEDRAVKAPSAVTTAEQPVDFQSSE